MKLYLRSHICKAEPMGRIKFLDEIKKDAVSVSDKDEEGYHVVYPDGYHSWCPKKIWEEKAREITVEELDSVEVYLEVREEPQQDNADD